jgi:hypothetical protein
MRVEGHQREGGSKKVKHTQKGLVRMMQVQSLFLSHRQKIVDRPNGNGL